MTVRGHLQFVWRSPGRMMVIGAVSLVTIAGVLGLSGVAQPRESGVPQIAPDVVDFSRQVRPILANSCFKCHGPDGAARQAGLRLDIREGATATRKGGLFAIVPGNPDQSELVKRVSSHEDDVRMPPVEVSDPLSAEQIETLRRWIEQGAEYQEHWAWLPPVRPAMPMVGGDARVTNEIDAFVQAHLRSAGLEPSPEADRAILLRRLSLDLTGLPPTLEEASNFLDDDAPDAYARAIDRLLASPRFGERWARPWLDLARYADTKGYEKDGRRTIWPYRDWVIRALNDDMPFDRFTIEQLAGDLLPNPTNDNLVATAFHRNTMTNDEGGTDDAEFRHVAVVDRANTTMQVWMGLTVGCAQCHSHKYDPISHREYYRFLAFFNQTEDADRPDDQPLIAASTVEQREESERLEIALADAKLRFQAETPAIAAAQLRWETETRANAVRWTPVLPEVMESVNGTILTAGDDGTILASGPNPATEIHTLQAVLPLGDVTALRIEVAPDASLPGPGPGRTTHGNFVLNELLASAESVNAVHRPVRGRYIRVSLPGEGRMLSLAEVQVFSELSNIAPGGTATQSSTDYGGEAELAIDGNTDGRYDPARSTTHTANEANPWWELDLGEESNVDHVVVWNRTDGGLQHRLHDARIELLNETREVVWSGTLADAPKPRATLNLGERVLLEFTNADATHSQPDWPVARAVDGNAGEKSGWAVGPRYGTAHAAVFQTSTGFGFGEEIRLRIALVQSYGSQHTLGTFKIAATDSPGGRLSLPPRITELLAIRPADRGAEEQAEVDAYFRSVDPAFAEIRDEIASIESRLAEIERSVARIPIMRELAGDRRRTTHIHERGSFLSPGKEVEPGVPAVFPDLPRDAPADRLGLARWLVSRDNPLTARVQVNRVWEQFFGVGLVETSEDFGTQGSLPTHADLIDWLAVEFMESGWSLKDLCKTIVMSSTYRQTSRVTPELLDRDPRNLLLARGPRNRLEAEMIRDQALEISGLLSEKMYGPPVFPPQPEGVWQMVYSNERWMTSPDEDGHRRALYTFWRRTSPYPSMLTFDAPSREFCVSRRITTNTPLQALVTLNDPVYVEAAQALARRMMAEAVGDNSDRARHGFRLCLVREPNDDELDLLVDLYETELRYFRINDEAALQMATDPIGAAPEGANVAELAAWTVVGNVLLNLDELLTKG